MELARRLSEARKRLALLKDRPDGAAAVAGEWEQLLDAMSKRKGWSPEELKEMSLALLSARAEIAGAQTVLQCRVRLDQITRKFLENSKSRPGGPVRGQDRAGGTQGRINRVF